MRSVFAMTDIEEINTEGVGYVFPHAFAATGRLKSIRFYGHTVIEDLAFMSSEIHEVYLSRDTMVSSDAFAYCRNLEKGFVAYEHGWMGDYLEDTDFAPNLFRSITLRKYCCLSVKITNSSYNSYYKSRGFWYARL